MADNPSISVVIPVFNEEESLERLYSALSQVLEPISNWEIIFVDDGSDDDSFNIMKTIVENDNRVRIVSFYRNYGKSAALSEGFKLAKGKYVITIDADLQDDPKEIPNLISKLFSPPHFQVASSVSEKQNKQQCRCK